MLGQMDRQTYGRQSGDEIIFNWLVGKFINFKILRAHLYIYYVTTLRVRPNMTLKGEVEVGRFGKERVKPCGVLITKK